MREKKTELLLQHRNREELSLYKMLVIYRQALMFTLTGVQHNTASAVCVSGRGKERVPERERERKDRQMNQPVGGERARDNKKEGGKDREGRKRGEGE